MKKIIIIVSALVCFTWALQAQNITVQGAIGQTPETMVLNHLMSSDGVYIFNVTYNNASSPITSPSIGTFDAHGNPSYNAQTGICLSNGDVAGIAGPLTNTGGTPPVTPYYTDPVMNDLSLATNGAGVTACSSLEFDFVSTTDHFSFNYVYSSVEYIYYVGTEFVDLFAILLTGPDMETGEEVTRNIALVPGSVTDSTPDGLVVSVNTINSGSPGLWTMMTGYVNPSFTGAYSQWYIDHPYVEGDSVANSGIGYWGYTSKLTAESDILPCQVYHVRISICNVQDNAVDSGVLLEEGSFQSPSAQIGLSRLTVDTVPGSCGLSVPLTLAQTAAFDEGTVHFAFGGDAVYGADYELVDELGRSLDSTGLAIDNDVHSIVVRALPGADLSEPKSVELYLQTSLCPQFPELVTHDTMRFVLVRGGDVRVADTTIRCSHACFEVSAPLVYGDEPISYRWEPTTGLADPYSLTTAAAIFESTDYMLIATGGSGCNSDTARVHIVITGEDPVDIDEVGGLDPEVRVWPNPAGDVIHVESEMLRSVELYSLEGRRLGVYNATGSTLDIPTEGLSSGTYGLRVVTAAGSMGAKIVVNK